MIEECTRRVDLFDGKRKKTWAEVLVSLIVFCRVGEGCGGRNGGKVDHWSAKHDREFGDGEKWERRARRRKRTWAAGHSLRSVASRSRVLVTYWSWAP